MASKNKPELSKKSRYFVERHRYYELKHFCLQYPIWRKRCALLDGFADGLSEKTPVDGGEMNDPTAKCAEARLFYINRMEMVEKAALDTEPGLGLYILQAVSQGLSYDYLKTNLQIPCCRAVYYELYRRFFWLLDKARG